jgi:serine/threonine protein kinase
METAEPWTQKWVKIQPLGGGGQGDTLLVKSLSGEFDRAVLKLLKPQKAQDAKARGRMAQEVINLKVLRNAGGKVPQVLDGNTEKFEDPNVPLYFVMEYINGKTLAETVQASGGLPVSTSVGIALDLCTTMQNAIKERIVHRDIKPENIILRSTDPADVVIVDFGLSFNEDEALNLTETEETLDNKFISLPERRGPGENKRDFRSDLTGICAILFYCLTECAPRNLRDSQGRPPHQWPNYSISGKVQDELQRDALNLFFSRGLNYEIDFRFQTIDELITRLNEILKPKTTEITEDLETVVAREAAALRKSDRKTQLAEYITCIQPLQQSYQLCCQDISSKLSKQRSFSLGWQAMTTQLTENSEQGEIIARVVAWVVVQNHPIMFQIHHTFISQGSECTVYRDIREGPLNSRTQIKIADPAVVVLRYKGDTAPNAPAIITDFKAAITKAITLISHKIQSGN